MTFQLAGRLADPDREALTDGCPIERSSALLGRRSTLVLLREAAYGTARFDDFVRRTGLTESVTAAQLRELVSGGLLHKRPYQEPGQRVRQEYVLTEAGEDAVPVLLALAAWGDKHLPRSHRIEATHADCGAPVTATLRCAEGHDVPQDEVVMTPRSRRSR
jgi:DNA-binding HxlR family transcriptional regulator